jgi:hypothetical protein
MPGDPNPYARLSYSTPGSYPGDPDAKIISQLRLAVTFTYVAAALDALLAVGCIAIGVLVPLIDTGPPDPHDPPDWFISLLYISFGAVMLAFAIVKAIAGGKLRRCGPTARGWGLAAGIVGTTQFLCLSCCLIQPGFGLYTIIVLASQQARDCLGRLYAAGRTLE